ncbi:MAG: DNA-processing protein DprA [bacterium]
MEVATDIVKISIDDLDYPAALKEIADAPTQLFVRGNLQWGDRPVIAIVGSRKPTPYGIATVRDLVGKIAPGAVIVSGLAYGIDELAHRAALKASGITVAVLGSGIDDKSIYPARNLSLAQEIIVSGGAIISEYPPGTEPLPYHFPMRNRIIAGLSQKLVVIEAAEESGALITAKLALDYNREVMAVPGPITSPMSVGPNRLIQAGAAPVLRAEDIAPARQLKLNNNLTPKEEMIYKALVPGPKHFNDIVAQTQLSAAEVSSTLTILEMQGRATNLGGNIFTAVS